MLRRKIETQLEAWRSAPKRTALLVTGARQIGKTYIIRHFAQQHYDHIAELNFIENPDLVALFDRPRDAKNPTDEAGTGRKYAISTRQNPDFL